MRHSAIRPDTGTGEILHHEGIQRSRALLAEWPTQQVNNDRLALDDANVAALMLMDMLFAGMGPAGRDWPSRDERRGIWPDALISSCAAPVAQTEAEDIGVARHSVSTGNTSPDHRYTITNAQPEGDLYRSAAQCLQAGEKYLVFYGMVRRILAVWLRTAASELTNNSFLRLP